jgi:hypothetical protein
MRRKVKLLTDGLIFVKRQAANPDASKHGELDSALRSLKDGPTLLGFALGVVLGPAVALFKVITTRSVSTLSRQSDVREVNWKTKGEDKSPIETFLADPDTQPGKSLLEFQTVTLVLGFLASVGITLKWNVGAIAPFLLAIGLAYLCYNLGFLSYIVRKSRADLASIVVLITFILVLAVLPDIINIWQGGTVYSAPVP